MIPYTRPMCTLPSPLNVTIHLKQNISKLLQSIYVSLKLLGINLLFQTTANFCDFRALWKRIYCMTIAMYTILLALTAVRLCPLHHLTVNLFLFRSADIVPHR